MILFIDNISIDVIKNMILAIILVIILILAFIIHNLKNNNISKNVQSNNIKKLMRQVYRWYIASIQDNNPVIAMLHINYAVGYLSALMEISSEDEIYKVSGLNIRELQKEVTKQQDKSLLAVFENCPDNLKDLIGETNIYGEYLNKLQNLYD